MRQQNFLSPCGILRDFSCRGEAFFKAWSIGFLGNPVRKAGMVSGNDMRHGVGKGSKGAGFQKRDDFQGASQRMIHSFSTLKTFLEGRRIFAEIMQQAA